MFNFVRFSKKAILPLVVVCLLAQPLTLLPETQISTIFSTEFKLSDALASPCRKNFKDTSGYWLENYAQTKLNPTSEEAWQAEAQKQLLNLQLNGPQENLSISPRLELLRELQTINTKEKKSILKGIDKTLTQTGKMALFNLLAQEQQSWEVVKNRRNFIKLLVENPDFLVEIRQQLTNIAANERTFIDGLFTAE